MDVTAASTSTTANSATNATKQGFRFYKSGSTSASTSTTKTTTTSSSSSSSSQSTLQRIPSHPTLVSESPGSGSVGGVNSDGSFGGGNANRANKANHTATSSSSSLSSSLPSSSSSSSSSSPSSSVPFGADAKLHQIVKRIATGTPSLLLSSSSAGNKASQQSRKNNIQAVTSLVLEKHREYRRKDLNWVKSGVEGALAALGSSAGGNGSDGKKRRVSTTTTVPVGGGSNNDTRSSFGDSDGRPNSPAKKKRTLRGIGEGAENGPIAEERGVVAETNLNLAEPSLALTRSNSGGMLNAGLRNRYKDVQKEREQQQQQSAANALMDGAISGANEDDPMKIERVASPTAETSDDKANSASTDSPNNPTKKTASNTATTPKKKKKTKKTPSKSSSSSSSAANHRTQNQDDGPYSSNAALLQPSPRPSERYSNLGGISSLLQQLRELIEYPLSHPELFLHLGVEPPRGVLLRGPPGCGKTHLAKAIAGELDVSYFQVSAPELVGGVSGESEARVRTLFESAGAHAPAIVFIDEIDAIAPKRGEGSGGGGGGKSMEKRIVAQLLTSMDSIHPRNTRNGSAVMVLGATNRPDAMDPALRRAGRFDREIVLGAPDERAREGILRVMTKEMRVDESLDFKVLAKRTPGFVGADVRSLTKEAAVVAINRIFQKELLNGDNRDGIASEANPGGASAEASNEDGVENDASHASKEEGETTEDNAIRSITPLTPEQLRPLHVTMDDFLAALPHVQPSSKREGFATVPDVSWGDIGALSSIREELTLSVLEPIGHPERFEALGLPLPAGVLLYGPPGCGKTLLAKAIANESGANFISVKGPELLDKYVGESERSVRVVFERARSSSPCIIFFDELDSLCPKRGSDGGGGGGVSERVVNQLLTEMDGLDSRRSVFVIAATNRPELIDPAMLRPGRLDKLLYVPLPSPDDRHSILCALSTKIKLGPDVDLDAIARNPHADGFSGADCAALLREAGLAVLRDGVLSRTSTQNKNPAPSGTAMSDENGGGEGKKGNDEASLCITAHHFQYAFEHVLPSVSRKDQSRYDRLRDRMARARTRGGAGSTTTEGRGDASDLESSVPLPLSSEGSAHE